MPKKRAINQSEVLLYFRLRNYQANNKTKQNSGGQKKVTETMNRVHQQL